MSSKKTLPVFTYEDICNMSQKDIEMYEAIFNKVLKKKKRSQERKKDYRVKNYSEKEARISMEDYEQDSTEQGESYELEDSDECDEYDNGLSLEHMRVIDEIEKEMIEDYREQFECEVEGFNDTEDKEDYVNKLVGNDNDDDDDNVF